MPEVQNVGAADYAQYQPSEYSNNEAYEENYNTMPEVYDENAEQMRKAAKTMFGATLFTSIIIGGLAYWGGRASGKKGLEAQIKKANEATSKLEELQNKVSELQTAKDAAVQEVADKTRALETSEQSYIDKTLELENKMNALEETASTIKRYADNVINATFGGLRGGKDFAKKVKELMNTLLRSE